MSEESDSECEETEEEKKDEDDEIDIKKPQPRKFFSKVDVLDLKMDQMRAQIEKNLVEQ